MKTVHIVEHYPPYKVRNERTFKNSHTKHLKKRQVLLINGEHLKIQVVSIMNQQFELIGEDYVFTCDLQYKTIDEEE